MELWFKAIKFNDIFYSIKAKKARLTSLTVYCNMNQALKSLLLAGFFSFAFCSCLPKKEEPSTLYIQVPLVRQSTNYTCGVAAMQSLLAYYGDYWREDRLSKILRADSAQGTNYRNILSFCDSLGYHTKAFTNMSTDSLKHFVDQGYPMLLAIQAWSGAVPDYKNDWNNGHYVLCIGYDDDNYYFMDPSTLGNYTFIPAKDFEERWHDIDQEGMKLYNFALWIYKQEKKYEPGKILPMN